MGNSESLSRLLRKLPIFEMASQSRGKPARLVEEPRFPFVYHSRSPPPPPKGTTGSTKNSTRKMATVSCRRVEDLNATDQIDWNCKLAVLLMAAFGFGGIQSQKENAISFFSSKSQISKFQDLQTDHSAT